MEVELLIVGESMFAFWGTAEWFSPVTAALYSCRPRTMSPVSPHPRQHLLCFRGLVCDGRPSGWEVTSYSDFDLLLPGN